MPEIVAHNVHDILPKARNFLLEGGEWNSRRNGPVVEYCSSPVVLTYLHPLERVLYYADRDANPFFHLAESLWMLAGRQDVTWLSQWSSQIAQYSDDGLVFNGAYGYRWRHAFGKDQIQVLKRLLLRDPQTRRANLQMWLPKSDLHSSEAKTRDACCNLSALFYVSPEERLNLTVFNRSNDLILGCCGANAVHFSYLLEYIASSVGIEVGRYNQVSNNLHAYKEPWEKFVEYDLSQADPYLLKQVKPFPLMQNPRVWDRELYEFIFATSPGVKSPLPPFQEPFFGRIASPMFRSHVAWRNRENPDRYAEAKAALENMPEGDDWRRAMCEWLNRREERTKA